jgi:hypothetical protein
MSSDHPSSTPSLPGLPGAGLSGAGPVVDPLLDDLLSAAVPALPAGWPADPIGQAVAVHRDHQSAWYGDLLGPLRVPASATEAMLAALLPSDAGVPIVLLPDLGSEDLLGRLRAARSLLLDNHRIELVGVELPFAAADSAADAARLTLEALDFTVPAWFIVPAGPGWEPAFDVLAEDGAESIALVLPPPGSPDVFASVAAVLRALIDRELPYSITGGVTTLVTSPAGHGLLNLLCATRAALNGAEATELAGILAETSADPLASAARRMSEADAAIVRAFLPTVAVPSIRAMIDALELEGLISPSAA